MIFLILIDGLSVPVFERLLASGRLPHLRRNLLERLPGLAGQALSSFPSTTAPALTELLAGTYCDRHQQLPRKIHAFDRESGDALRYEFQPQAWKGEPDDIIRLAGENGGSVLSFFRGELGGARPRHNDLLYSLDAITDYSSLQIFNVDSSAIADLARGLQRGGQRYSLVFLYLTTVDLNGHFHGPEDQRYARAAEEIDRSLGTLFGALEALPGEAGGTLLDESHFVVFADHGMITSGHHIDLAGALQGFGLAPADIARLGTIVRTALRPNWWEDFDLLVVPSGSSVAELYVRAQGEERPLPWRIRTGYESLRGYPGRGDPILRIDLARVLQSHRGIDVILLDEAPGCVRLISPAHGEGRVLRRGRTTGQARFAYQMLSGERPDGDPLGYLREPGFPAEMVTRDPELAPATLDDPRFDGCFHSLADWLAATWDCQRPGAVPLVPKAFADHPTRSEILVTARRGFGFMRLSKGDHGDLGRDSMMAPLILAGPRVNPEACLGRFRLLDLYPVLADLLGVPAGRRPADLDAVARPDLLRPA